MILVRNTFQLKFGKAKDAKTMMKEGLAIADAGRLSDSNRAYIDMTGQFYTLVFENTFANLGAYESAHDKFVQNEAWKKWYGSFIELVESGHREIFSIIE